MSGEIIERLLTLARQGRFAGCDKYLPCPSLIEGTPALSGEYITGLDNKRALIFNSGIVPLENVELYAAQPGDLPRSEFELESEQLLARFKNETNFYDAPRWSPCAFILEGGKLSILVRESSYLALRAVRGKSAQELQEHFLKGSNDKISALPNLLTVYGSTETKDGYLVFALRDPSKSDQDDVTAKPAGFISLERRESVKDCIMREFDEELAIVRGNEAVASSASCIRLGQTLHLGNTFALDGVWDITNHAYLPLDALSSELAMPLRRRGQVWCSEHKLMVLVPNSSQAISSIMKDGAVKADSLHLKFSALALASLQRYSAARSLGKIRPETARQDSQMIVSDRSIRL